jgi:hypothetical protein
MQRPALPTQARFEPISAAETSLPGLYHGPIETRKIVAKKAQAD